jgi:hypothetical protein
MFLGTHDDPMCADASPFPNDGDADDVLGPGLPGYAPFLSHWRSILFVLCLGTLNSFVNWRESRCELSLVLAARWDLFFVVAQMNWHFILLVHAAIGLYFWSRSSSLCAQILIQRRQRELQGELRCCRTSWYGPLFETSKTELLYMH